MYNINQSSIQLPKLENNNVKWHKNLSIIDN